MKKLLAFFLVVLSAIAFNRCNPYDTVTVTDVTVNPATLDLVPGETATLTATVIPDYATNRDVIWESDNKDVATVDVAGTVGTVKAHAAGKATITVTTADGGKTATCKVTVMGTLEFTVGGVTFNMIPVAGGTFLMGSQKTDAVEPNYNADASDRESPVHSVTLTQDYWMGEFEVTQGLWKAVMDSNPSYYKNGDNHPVEQVSWDDICGTEGFLAKLNKMLELEAQLDGKEFVLPTEAQWEFAAAGGKKGYNADDTRKHTYSGSNDINEVAWWGYSSSPQGTAKERSSYPVGQKPANELGIYDMSGNVWEWCADRYGDYGTDAVTDPTGPTTGSSRVFRGGSWYYGAGSCRVSYRTSDSPDDCGDLLGFRLALVFL